MIRQTVRKLKMQQDGRFTISPALSATVRWVKDACECPICYTQLEVGYPQPFGQIRKTLREGIKTCEVLVDPVPPGITIKACPKCRVQFSVREEPSQMRQSSYQPDFVGHFPHTSPGHGSASENPGRKLKCVESRCQLNMPAGRAGSEKHQKGSAHNAGVWIRDVGYTGPDPGVTAEEERPPRREKVESIYARCHDRCEVRGTLHSVCIYPKPFKTSLLDQMAARVEGMSFTSMTQQTHRLTEYLGASMEGRER